MCPFHFFVSDLQSPYILAIALFDYNFLLLKKEKSQKVLKENLRKENQIHESNPVRKDKVEGLIIVHLDILIKLQSSDSIHQTRNSIKRKLIGQLCFGNYWR